MKLNGEIVDVNWAKNSSNVIFRFETAILNLWKCSSPSDLANLSNSPKIFYRSWIIYNTLSWKLTDIRFALILIILKEVFLPWSLI